MKVVAFAALALVAALEASQSPHEVSIVIDTDSPVAKAEESATVRDLALADIELIEKPRHFTLSRRSLDAVAGSAAENLRRTIFAAPPARYNGISLSFFEASEILRKNESIRETVIGRECMPSRARECPDAVIAAATALADDTEASSAAKLRHVARFAGANPGARLILVTAGWPYRDQERLDLQGAVRTLRAAGCKLIVLRQPSSIDFRDLVKDAAQALAARLPSPFVALDGPADVGDARRLLAEAYGPIPSSSLSDALTAPPLVIPPEVAAQQAPSSAIADDVLRRAAAYIRRFEESFSSLVWRERYVQEDRVERRFGASGATFMLLVARRVLESELLFIWLPRDASWIAVRDVASVDGKPRPAVERQLPALLAAPSLSIAELRLLAAENGRFNIGRIVRTFNEPTLALLFLDDQYRRRFAFKAAGLEKIGGRQAVAYQFVEEASPAVIRDGPRDLPTRGKIWIDAPSGSVVQTLLELFNPSGVLAGRMTVTYRPHPKFDVLVPVEMRETYASSSREEVTAVATYSNFRRFETSGRLVLPR